MSGKYQTNLPEVQGLTISFVNDFVLVRGGCNLHDAPYLATESGKFEVGQFISTAAFCENDQDGIYLDALRQASTYTNGSSRIILRR